MNYKELLEKATKLDKETTPGPWMWDLRTATKQCNLVTQHSGQYYVMGFERWGMQEALPTFQLYDRHEGKMSERGSHGMVRADRLSKSYPGKEHHIGFDDYIDNPDAVFIAESRQLVHDLTVALSELIEKHDTQFIMPYKIGTKLFYKDENMEHDLEGELVSYEIRETGAYMKVFCYDNSRLYVLPVSELGKTVKPEDKESKSLSI